MNINELHSLLKRKYKKGLDCGIIKSPSAVTDNIYFVIPPSPPIDLPSNVSLARVSEALSFLRKLPSYEEMDDLDRLINYLLVRREAVLSSRLEGTWSTINEVLTPPHNEGQGPEATLSVRGYAHALEKVFNRAAKEKESVFTSDLICDIHREIMAKDPNFNGVSGRLRAPGTAGSVVYIGGLRRPENSIYNPAPPEHVQSSLSKVLSWLADKDLADRGDAGVGLTLPVRIALGHSHFEAVHPFPDGNGRVGRALWPLQMISAGLMPLYLSGFVEREKRTYYEVLQAAQKKLDYGPIIDFISEAIISSAMELKITKEALKSLPFQWRERGRFRKNSAFEKSLMVILKGPIFTMEILKEEIGCSTQAAANAIHQLVEKNIIKERSGGRRNRVFAAEEVIAILSREHGSDIELALEKARRILT